MVLSIPISPAAEAALRAKAEAAGTDVVTYAARQLEEGARPPRSIRDLSGPAYAEFVASGMTDDELGDLLEEAKHEARAERRKRADP